MKPTILYIHGQGGCAEEAEHYRPLFPGWEVVGLSYSSQSPWEAAEEFPRLWDALCKENQPVILIANSIGAFYAMHALADRRIEKAFLISPVVNMQLLIETMLLWANVSETELREKGTIETNFGQTLSWEYLSYVRAHPIRWNIPTHILYGEQDNLTPLSVITQFAKATGATLTVMPDGEHWFHTKPQMEFLNHWIQEFQQ